MTTTKPAHGVEIHKFIPEHIDMMDMRQREWEAGADFWKGLAKLPPDQVATYMIDGEVLCVAGYVSVAPGNIEVFVLPSIYVPAYPVAFQANVKRVLNEWGKIYPRMQTHSHDDPQTNKWMRKLGFIWEGLHPRYCRGLTYMTWARFS